MVHGFVRALVKVTVASLIVGAIMNHFGITAEQVIKASGLSEERLMDLARQGFTWALPNLLLGSLVIVPIWFLIYLFPRRPAIDARRLRRGQLASGRPFTPAPPAAWRARAPR